MASLDEDVWDAALAWLGDGHAVALATVIDTWGSSPRPRGSHLVVRDDGVFLGSVSGGCVEAKVVEAAGRVLRRGAPLTLDFGVSNEDALGVGLACGGKVLIRVEPIGAELRAVLDAVAAARADKRAAVIITPLAEGARPPFVFSVAGGELGSELEVAAARALATDDAASVETASGKYFLRPVSPPLRLFVVGAVHIARPLVTMARELGFDVTVVDPRAAFTRAERWPDDVTVVNAWPDEALAAAGVDERTAVVALTHDPKIDDVALEVALKTKAFYVGALGSRKSQASRLGRLGARGFDASALARVHGPIGLAIGARTPAEIAVSIVAEMTDVRCRPLRRPRVAGVVVAAGLSSRMGGENKLLADVGGEAIVARVVDALLEGGIDPLLVVLGHEAERVRARLADRRVRFVDNLAYAEGLGASIRAGFRALHDPVDAAVLALGDMPKLRADHVKRLVASFDRSMAGATDPLRGPSTARSIYVPVHAGRRGHPVLWSARHFPELRELEGDVGARALLERHAAAVHAVAVDDAAIHFDVDDPARLAEARGPLP